MYYRHEINFALEEVLLYLRKSQADDPLLTVEEVLRKHETILDNWAVCDTFCSDAKWMKQAEKDILWQFIERWFKSDREFEVRFATVAAMCYFTDKEWLPRVFQKIDKIVKEGIDNKKSIYQITIENKEEIDKLNAANKEIEIDNVCMEKIRFNHTINLFSYVFCSVICCKQYINFFHLLPLLI